MKKLFGALMLSVSAIALLTSCSKSSSVLPSTGSVNNTANRTSSTAIASNCSTPYSITLESITDNGNGTYTWVWSVKNLHPGNGNGGTAQDLSHWDMYINNCSGTDGATTADLVSAGYSSNGSSWTNFTPSLASDPSISNTCGMSTGNVLKFNLGTSGSTKSWYRLTVSRDFDVNMNAQAWYKSGSKTKCGTECYPGMGCQQAPPPGDGGGDTEA